MGSKLSCIRSRAGEQSLSHGKNADINVYDDPDMDIVVSTTMSKNSTAHSSTPSSPTSTDASNNHSNNNKSSNGQPERDTSKICTPIPHDENMYALPFPKSPKSATQTSPAKKGAKSAQTGKVGSYINVVLADDNSWQPRENTQPPVKDLYKNEGVHRKVEATSKPKKPNRPPPKLTTTNTPTAGLNYVEVEIIPTQEVVQREAETTRTTPTTQYCDVITENGQVRLVSANS